MTGWVGSRLRGGIRRQTIISLVLLLLVMGCLVYGASGSVRGIEPALLWPLVVAGLFLGWALARSRLRGWLAAVVILLVGLVLLILGVGRLGSPLGNLFAALFGAEAAPARASAVSGALAELQTGMTSLLTRTYRWLAGLLVGNPVFDPVAIALLWGGGLWLASVWAGWAVRRRSQPLLAVAPAVGLLALTLAYVNGRPYYLAPMLVSALVLKALVGHDELRNRWDRARVGYSPHVRSETAWMAIGLALALIAVAVIAPSVSFGQIVDAVRDLSQSQDGAGELADSLGLEARATVAPGAATTLIMRSAGRLPANHLIGAGPELAEELVMVVSVEYDSLVLGEHGNPNGAPPRYYWRGLTYDSYTGLGWSTNVGALVSYNPGESAASIPDHPVRLVRQSVEFVQDTGGSLHAAGTLLTADKAFWVGWRQEPGPDQTGDAFGAAVDATTYRTDSYLPIYDEAGLWTAGQDYPDWVADRYLRLPGSVPDRVTALGRDLTATEPTPYDRALAIESYLRGIPYTLDLPAPPTDRDLVEYFLFELREGYCDYYASAMVVLARSAGLPARLATGYATGSYDAAAGSYLVSAAEAHSWPEVYFPSYGWIPFEPTAGLPAMEHGSPSPPALAEPEAEPLEPINARALRTNRAFWLSLAAGLLSLAMICFAGWWLLDHWRLRRLSPDAAIVDLYRRLGRYARLLGVEYLAGDTPNEYTFQMADRLEHLQRERHWGESLAGSARQLCRLADLCTRTLYSQKKLTPAEGRQALDEWPHLRTRLWLARFLPHRRAKQRVTEQG